MSKPTLEIFSLKYLVFSCIFFIKLLSFDMRSIASIEAPTIAGASVLENRYGLDF